MHMLLSPYIKYILAIKISTRVHALRASGTSLVTTRCARPSTMAVFPTPGSPTKMGLFLVRRASTCQPYPNHNTQYINYT